MVGRSQRFREADQTSSLPNHMLHDPFTHLLSDSPCSVIAVARGLVGLRGLAPLPDDECRRAEWTGLSRAARLRLKPLTPPWGFGMLPVTAVCSATSLGRALGCSRSRMLLVQGDGEGDAGEVGERRKLDSLPGEEGGELPYSSGAPLTCSGAGLAFGALQDREASWGVQRVAGTGLSGGDGAHVQGAVKEMEWAMGSRSCPAEGHSESMEITEPCCGSSGDEGGAAARTMLPDSVVGQLLVRCMMGSSLRALRRRVVAGDCGAMEGFSHACTWRSWRDRRLLASCRHNKVQG